MKHALESCPNCSAIWGVGSEEWEWQQCDACGWPDNENDYEEDDWDDDPEPDYRAETPEEFRDRMVGYQKLK